MSSGFNSGEEDSVKERKIKAKRLDTDRINGLKKLAADKDSRAWLWQFLQQADPFVTPFNSQSEFTTAFNCGAKIMPVQIVQQMLQHCPAEYYLMIHESKERDNE